METINKLFENPGFTSLAGVFLGAFCTYLISLRLSFHNAKMDAGKRFRETMYEFLAWFQSHPNKFYPPNFEETIQKQRTNALEFRHFLSRKSKTAFDKAWDHYAEPKGEEKWITRDMLNLDQMKHRIEKLVDFTRKRSFLSF